MNTNALRTVFALIGAALVITGTAAQDAQYTELVCTPLTQDVGRFEPEAAAELMRWEDGRLRTVDQGGEYYATEPKDAPLAEWILVFGAQSQRGNSEIGFVRSENLECQPL